MESMTITLAILGALAGGAGGFGLHVLEDFGGFFLGIAKVAAGDRSPSLKEPSLTRYIATGALAGGLLFGSVPAIHDHFTGAASPKPVTMQDCVKSAPANMSRIELATHEDGSKFCRFTP